VAETLSGGDVVSRTIELLSAAGFHRLVETRCGVLQHAGPTEIELSSVTTVANG
jgi:hypothetical protein